MIWNHTERNGTRGTDMESTIIRERKARRLYHGFLAFYCLHSAALVTLYALRQDVYHLSITLGTFAFPILLELVWRLSPLRRVWQLDCLVLGFVFIAYPLGSCVDLFHWLPGFDKVAHTLSGTFTSVLALMLFYGLKPGHRVERADAALAVSFMLLSSIAVAGLWEIGEYLVSGIVARDLQRVAETGVADSMQDMIVCTVGALATIPAALRLCQGRHGLFSGMVHDFIVLNFGSAVS